MLSKFHLVQKVHLTCDTADFKNLAVDRRHGQIDLSAFRAFLGKQLLKEVLLRFHSIKPRSLDTVLSCLMWRVRLLAYPSRISISYWLTDKSGKQAKRFRILFKSELVPGEGYVLTTKSFRRGDAT